MKGLQKRLHMVRMRPGLYRGRPYWQTIAEIERQSTGRWRLSIRYRNAEVERTDGTLYDCRTFRNALKLLDLFGDIETTTRNILNPKAGRIPIALRYKGGPCDPGTETYHSA